MCCASCNDNTPVGECKVCGGDVDADGESTNQCEYSSVQCSVCHSAPCDESC